MAGGLDDDAAYRRLEQECVIDHVRRFVDGQRETAALLQSVQLGVELVWLGTGLQRFFDAFDGEPSLGAGVDERLGAGEIPGLIGVKAQAGGARQVGDKVLKSIDFIAPGHDANLDLQCRSFVAAKRLEAVSIDPAKVAKIAVSVQVGDRRLLAEQSVQRNLPALGAEVEDGRFPCQSLRIGGGNSEFWQGGCIAPADQPGIAA